jgi:uncharacterized repeat protein (TIGR01451 family)
MKQKIIICLLAFVAFCSFSTLQAQGWDKTFTGASSFGDTTLAYSVVETPDSGFVFAGGQVSAGVSVSVFVVKTDKRGNLVWKYNGGFSGLSDTLKIFQTADNGFLVIGTARKFDNATQAIVNYIGVVKLNSNGVEQSVRTYLSGNNFTDADITPNLDEIVVASYQFFRSNNFISLGSNLLRLSPNGDSIGVKPFPSFYMRDIAIGGDRQIYAIRQISTQGPNVFAISKFSSTGDSLWTIMQGQFQMENSIKRVPDGRLLVSSYLKLDYDGRVIFNARNYSPPVPSNLSVSEVFTQRKGDNSIYLLSNYDQQNPSNTSNLFFIKKDSIGRQVLAQKLIESFSSAYFRDIIPTSDGGFLLAGKTQRTRFRGQARLLKLNENGLAYPNFLRGTLYIDSIQNCRLDAREKGAINRLVNIVKPNSNRWAVTDSMGNYALQIDTGNYIISSVLPNSNWRFCAPSVSKSITTFGATDTANIALQAAFYCPKMQISASTFGLRRCFDNNYYQIRYTNDGTVDAQNAFITLKLDSLLEYVGASRPLSSRTGQTLRFNIGTVPVDFNDQFSVQVRVRCGDSTKIGQTLCTEARIFPDTICVPPANWSGANIVVSGRCDRDSVRFIIQNTGAAASSNLRRRIVEDELVFLNGDISIPALTSRTITVPANGKTWRLNMAQEPNNPANDFPTAVVEGCRTSATQPISTGIVNQFPTDNGSPTIKNVCTPIVGAFDPNDKEGLPLGYKTSRFIDQNQAIDYRIRFQNTGNDTAFTIVLRDTLSDFLDISSIKTGASSHKYTWAIEGQNVLVFRFDNILLVDSFINVAASQGFVSFKINQKKDVALGAKINNLADIYFDYNAPIRTNKTLHTVGKDFVVSVLETKSALANIQINVFPNPFNAEATIDIQGFEKFTPLSIKSNFSLFDAFGKQLRHEKFEGNQFTFRRQDLATGIYFFRIENNGRLIGTGKFLIK